MKILPLTYLGSIEWFAQLYSGDVMIDLGENYVRQSCRNRCEILSSNGVMNLTVNIINGRSVKKKPLKDIRIDYSKRWQHQHWISILSAYKNSPYFDYLGDKFNSFYDKKYDFLADFNLQQLNLIFDFLGKPDDLKISEEYHIPTDQDIDLRTHSFLSKKAELETLNIKPYYQVFSEKLPFAPNLSIIDLFFCEGPKGAKEYLSDFVESL